MKRCLINRSFLYLLFFSCIFFQKSFCQNSSIDSIINPSSLQHILNILASDSLQGRFTGSEHAQKAAEFIATEFYKAGAAPFSGDSYFGPFALPGHSIKTAFNVMAILRGSSKPNELIIFCAHYDHVGTKSTSPLTMHQDKGGVL